MYVRDVWDKFLKCWASKSSEGDTLTEVFCLVARSAVGCRMITSKVLDCSNFLKLTCFSHYKAPYLYCRGCPETIRQFRAIPPNPRLVYAKGARLVRIFQRRMSRFPVLIIVICARSGLISSYLKHLPKLEIAVYILQLFTADIFKFLDCFDQ